MKTRPSPHLLFALVLLSGLLSIARAQEETAHAPDGNPRLTIANISIPPIPNAPFTATVTAEVTRHLEDGSTLTIKNHRTVARDSGGRIFQERRLLTEDGDIRETPVTQLEFSDPATHQIYYCDAMGKGCFVHPYFARTSLNPVVTSSSGEANQQVVSLGSSIINGVDTVGTRETDVISLGDAGSNRKISVTKEFWYSSQLGINILTKRFDPRFGEQVFQVTDVILGEPNPKLFELPPGSTILQEGPQQPSR